MMLQTRSQGQVGSNSKYDNVINLMCDYNVEVIQVTYIIIISLYYCMRVTQMKNGELRSLFFRQYLCFIRFAYGQCDRDTDIQSRKKNLHRSNSFLSYFVQFATPFVISAVRRQISKLFDATTHQLALSVSLSTREVSPDRMRSGPCIYEQRLKRRHRRKAKKEKNRAPRHPIRAPEK